ncbi:hypothetical protein DPMN_005295 [Dreissena polymorpha]|uniref:Uncharacterized protein n=1 Tax=Dreissena polymorpha TaxID=45954 RepID=A0A9D4RWD0_DREPO|nr:hypothetical protein DPMN_005295 [Dreissena polymorpha]
MAAFPGNPTPRRLKGAPTESRHGPDTRSGQGHDQEDSKTGRRRQSAAYTPHFPRPV